MRPRPTGLSAINIGLAGNCNCQKMEHEEQTPSESAEPTQPQAAGGSSPVRLIVMGVVLVAMVVMALVQSKAKAAHAAAVAVVEKNMDDGGPTQPVEFMNLVGEKPRIISTKDTLTQVYRWKGALQHFELRIMFYGSKGEYNVEDFEARAVSRFSAQNLSKLKLAEATGTEYKVFPKLDPIEEGGGSAMPSFPGGGPDGPGGPGGPGGPSGPSKGKGGGHSGAGGMSADRIKERNAALFKEIELTEDQSKKVDAILEKQLADTMAILGGPREEMRGKFTALREQYDAQFKAVLDEEQFEAYKKARDAARGNRGGNRGGGGLRPPPGENSSGGGPSGSPEKGK